jgi:hypothetical protein
MKVPDNVKDALPILINHLNERLLRVLTRDSFSLATASESPITVEMFLVALFQSFPDEVGSFFHQREPLLKMADELHPKHLNSSEISLPEISSRPESIISLPVDNQLAFLLFQTAQAASSSCRGRADIADFIGVLSLDDETTLKLQRNRNLILKGYLGQL